MALKSFFRKNIEASAKGNEEQQIDMEGVVAVTNQAADELGDMLSGKIKLKKNRHHPPKDLADAVITGIETIVRLRKQIEK